MKELVNLIEKSINKQLEDGTIQKIIDSAVSEVIRSAARDALSYNSPAKQYLDEQLKSIMLDMFKETDFTDYVNKIKYTINKALPETALPEYKEFVEGLQKRLGQKRESFKNISVTEMFTEYCNYIKDRSFSYDDFEDSSDIEDRSAYVNCEVELKTEDGKYSWDEKEYLEFSNDVDTSYNCRVYIKRWNDGDITLNNEYDFSDIRTLNSFQTYLLYLQNNWSKIVLDKEYEEDSVLVDVEY